MILKVIVATCLTLVVLESVLGAPHNSRKQENLEKSFIEFLQQDKELAPLLETGNIGSLRALSRSVRQAEIDDNDGLLNEESDNQPRKESGFFDRAAKFVMEVLQRFLKWVNADN